MFCDLQFCQSWIVLLILVHVTDLGMLWWYCPIMPDGFWPIGGDEREPCVSPLMPGIVCDEPMEYSEAGVEPYGLLMRR